MNSEAADFLYQFNLLSKDKRLDFCIWLQRLLEKVGE